MINGTASGKVILFGEHAAVYGRPAIAVPVTNVQSTARLRPNAEHGFRIVAADLKQNYELAKAPPHDPLAMMVSLTLRHLNQPVPDHMELYLTSTVPLGRGLGSGAAISTAIGRALAAWYGQIITPTELAALVYEVEKLHHGTPSGIDNTVIAFEQPVYFIKGQPVEVLPVAQPFSLVIGDTGIVSPTYRVVGDLRNRWQADPLLYEGYFDQIATLTRRARAIITTKGADLAELGQLMNQNHALLVTLGVSSPELERLVKVALQAGALGAKLSGAGWGGNMIALVAASAQNVADALRQAGAVGVVVTTVK